VTPETGRVVGLPSCTRHLVSDGVYALGLAICSHGTTHIFTVEAEGVEHAPTLNGPRRLSLWERIVAALRGAA
jgi:hypothetical protein